MPEKRTVQKARNLKRRGKATTTQAGPFVEEEKRASSLNYRPECGALRGVTFHSFSLTHSLMWATREMMFLNSA